VLLGIAAANRDPDRFATPDVFDPGPGRAPHLSFGHGIHFCVGAALARIEAEIAIGALIERYPRLALAVPPDELVWLPSFRTRSLVELPVRY
jgi:cytochrome P450